MKLNKLLLLSQVFLHFHMIINVGRYMRHCLTGKFHLTNPTGEAVNLA